MLMPDINVGSKYPAIYQYTVFAWSERRQLLYLYVDAGKKADVTRIKPAQSSTRASPELTTGAGDFLPHLRRWVTNRSSSMW